LLKQREFDGEELFEKSSSPNPTSKTFKQMNQQGVMQMQQKIHTNFVIFPENSIKLTLKQKTEDEQSSVFLSEREIFIR